MQARFLQKHHYCANTILVLLGILAVSCSTTNSGLFSKKTPHEAYTSKIENAGLQSTALGRQWLAAASKALEQPQIITLPYLEMHAFAAEQPRSAAYQFAARRGERINIQLTANPATGFLLFADLWQRKAGSNGLQLLLSADTLLSPIVYEAKEDGTYLLRLQPELLKNGNCTVSITTSPSLAFPIPAGNKRSILSVWGDNRDEGARKHEGIDIPGKLRTPLLAAADGYITSVREDKLGGKVVLLRPTGRDYTLYYAHLDEQLATTGQRVKLGDTIGLMGNTGNARNGLPHLHFGIYTDGGAVNPLPFVDFDRRSPSPITAPMEALNNYVVATKTVYAYHQPGTSGASEQLAINTPALVLAITDGWFKVQLPNNKEAFVQSKDGKLLSKPIKTYSFSVGTVLREEANDTAIVKKMVVANSALNLYGSYGNYNLVEQDGIRGWVKK